MVEVILTQNVKNLGVKNSVVKLKDGYSNYLISRGIAMLSNKANKSNLAETLRQGEQKEKKIRLEAEKLGLRLDSIQLVFSEKVDKGGKLFGTITPLNIAQAYKLHHITIAPKQISILNPPIKEPGSYQATLTLHKDLEKTIQFQVKSSS